MNPSQDFKEWLQCCAVHDVRGLIVGAHAVAWHGRPRYTEDLDYWVEPTLDNARQVIAALDEFGFGSLGVTVDDLTAPDCVIQLGYRPNRIDILTGISGVTFEDAWKNRVLGRYGDQETYYLGLDELRTNKKASGRAKDLDDLQALGEVT